MPPNISNQRENQQTQNALKGSASTANPLLKITQQLVDKLLMYHSIFGESIPLWFISTTHFDNLAKREHEYYYYYYYYSLNILISIV